MGDESAMSTMSGMSGMESSQSQGSTVDAPAGGGGGKKMIVIGVVLLLLVGVGVGSFLLVGQGKDVDDDGGGSGSSSSPATANPDDALLPPPQNPSGPVPPAPTPKARPQKPMENFVMCTVGVRFRDPEKYKDVPCDYIVFDNVVAVSTGIIPTQDFTAWKHFLELVAMALVTPMPGISFVDETSDASYAAPGKQLLKGMADKGIVAYGVGYVNIPAKTADVSKIISSLNSFFSSLADANSTIVGKGTFMTTFCFIDGGGSTPESLQEFLQKFTGNLVVSRTHVMLPPATFPEQCRFYATSSWSYFGVWDNVARPKFPVGVTFSMGVQLGAFNMTISGALPSPLKTCTYQSVTSYDDWCPLKSTEKYDQQTMEVLNRADQVVGSYSTAQSAAALIKKFIQKIKYTVGVLVADIQFDIIDSTACTESSLARVTTIADLIHGQAQKPNP
ncbi:uncharacterized protein LOC135396807 isoform X2 [Ornithodoros turicata]|uniref:uncharacterized protein LOC135396807 isoform X2 n=1 Tax=Ornithodoros turicata TaxID=34597 RepID=UPI00313A40EC